jgi:hypothetical protein
VDFKPFFAGFRGEFRDNATLPCTLPSKEAELQTLDLSDCYSDILDRLIFTFKDGLDYRDLEWIIPSHRHPRVGAANSHQPAGQAAAPCHLLVQIRGDHPKDPLMNTATWSLSQPLDPLGPRQ